MRPLQAAVYHPAEIGKLAIQRGTSTKRNQTTKQKKQTTGESQLGVVKRLSLFSLTLSRKVPTKDTEDETSVGREGAAACGNGPKRITSCAGVNNAEMS